MARVLSRFTMFLVRIISACAGRIQWHMNLRESFFLKIFPRVKAFFRTFPLRNRVYW